MWKIDQTMENNDSEYERRNSNLEAINDFKAYWDEEVQAEVLADKADHVRFNYSKYLIISYSIHVHVYIDG